MYPVWTVTNNTMPKTGLYWLIAKLASMSLYDYDHWGVAAVLKCGVGELQLV